MDFLLTLPYPGDETFRNKSKLPRSFMVARDKGKNFREGLKHLDYGLPDRYNTNFLLKFNFCTTPTRIKLHFSVVDITW